MEFVVLLVMGWVVMGFVGMFVSEAKGRGSGEGFLLGCLLGPLGVLVAALLPTKSTRESRHTAITQVGEERPMRACPHCAETILSAANICRYCQQMVDPVPHENVAIADPLSQKCKQCSADLMPGSAFCSSCGIADPLAPGVSENSSTDHHDATAPATESVGSGGKVLLAWIVGVIGIFVLASWYAQNMSGKGGAQSPRPTTSTPLRELSKDSLFAAFTASNDLTIKLSMAHMIADKFPGTVQSDSASAFIQAYDENLGTSKLQRKWRYSASVDQMTGNRAYFAEIYSENTVNFDFPYNGEQRGKLILRDHPSFGKSVMFRIEQGQLLCHSFSSCNVKVRFDDGPAERWGGNEPRDHTSELLFISNYSLFYKRLLKAKTVRIQVDVYQEGSPVFEFHIAGFQPDKYKPE